MVAALEDWANPSSVHDEGRRARSALEAARVRVLKGLGASPGSRLVFTSGASEALALALGRARAGGILASAVEHDAVFRSAPGATRIRVDGHGRIDCDHLAALLSAPPGPWLVAVQQVNNETGVVQDIVEIGRAVRDAGGLLLVDAAQSAGKLALPEADFIAVSAHKLGGPPGVGALILRDDRLLEPTGGQERGLRGGTENLPGILAFAAAAEDVEDWGGRTAPLVRTLEEALISAGGEIIAEGADRAPWIRAVRMPGVPAATQLIHFDLAGIAVSAGAACSSGSMKPSHVLEAMELGEDARREVIRVSPGPRTTPAEIQRFVDAWRGLRARIRVDAA